MLTYGIVQLVKARWAAILNPSEPGDTEPPVIESSQSSIGEVDGDVVVQIKAAGENLYKLEVDHNAAAHLPEFSIYADAGNPWGDVDAAAQAEGAGVLAGYDGDGLWTITLLKGGAALNAFMDHYAGRVVFKLVVHNSDGGASGSMYDQTYMTLELTVVPEAPEEPEAPDTDPEDEEEPTP